MGVRKKFDKDLYDTYDSIAKEAAKDALQKKGYTVCDNTDKYAQDLVAEKDGEMFLVETEVKNVWKGPEFPYDTVQLPQRKQKFFVEPTLFYIWNKQLDSAITFLSEDIKDLTPVEVPNRYVYKGEYFFQIPLDLTTRVKVRAKNEANT